MSDRNYNSNCRFAADIVAYLYDEIETREKAIFEAHLKSCSDCADELADFSFARFAVQEWRDEEFSPLKTPVFDIPLNVGQTKETVSANSDSVFDNLRRILSFRPIWALGALAIIITLGVTFAATNLFEPDFTAKKIDANSNNFSISPAEKRIEQTILETSVEPEVANSSESLVSENKNITPKKTETAQKVSATEVRKNSAGKISERKTKTVNTNKIAENVAASDVKDSNKNTTKDAPPINRQIPTLNSFEDDEDNTLRLAELFEDIDTRK